MAASIKYHSATSVLKSVFMHVNNVTKLIKVTYFYGLFDWKKGYLYFSYFFRERGISAVRTALSYRPLGTNQNALFWQMDAQKH